LRSAGGGPLERLLACRPSRSVCRSRWVGGWVGLGGGRNDRLGIVCSTGKEWMPDLASDMLWLPLLLGRRRLPARSAWPWLACRRVWWWAHHSLQPSRCRATWIAAWGRCSWPQRQQLSRHRLAAALPGRPAAGSAAGMARQVAVLRWREPAAAPRGVPLAAWVRQRRQCAWMGQSQ
jgi:hypothetical protein